MGIFNRAIPTIRTNEYNQPTVVPQEYYVDDIFDPLFNAKVREQLTLKYGNPYLGTVGGYLEGIDNALLGQDGKWGILGSGMGILSGFGRSMDKAGDFIIGGLTEGVKGVTGQGFENPLHNIFVEDQDYSGQRLLAAMGNSMAGLAKAPQLTEEDFSGLWSIPSIGLELATDPGILGGGLSKAANVNLAGQVATQSVNKPLATAGKLLMDYDDIMAKVAMDITAPGLRPSVKALKNKIEQMMGHSDYRRLANIKLNGKETPEARAQAAEELANDPNLKQFVEMHDELTTVEEAIAQAESMSAPTVPPTSANVSNAAPNRKSEQFKNLVAQARKNNSNLVRKAYFEDLTGLEKVSEVAKNRKDIVLDNLRKSVLYDDKRNTYAHRTALGYAQSTGLLNVNNASLFDVPQETVSENIKNYEALQKAYQDISQMSKSEMEAFGINPEYAEQIDLDRYDDESIAAGLFYEFTPNESARNAVMRMAGIDPKQVRGLQLSTPFTLSPSDFTGRSDSTMIEGLKASEVLLHSAFEAAGIPLHTFKKPEDLDILLDSSTEQGSIFATAFPKQAQREHLLDTLKALVFPEHFADERFKSGAVAYINLLNNFSNEIIANNKLREVEYIPRYLQIKQLSEELGVDPLEYLLKLKENTTFTDWELYRTRNSDFIDDISALENLYDISEDRSIIPTLLRGAELSRERKTILDAVKNNIDTPTYLAEADLYHAQQALEDLGLTNPNSPQSLLNDARILASRVLPDDKLPTAYSTLKQNVSNASQNLLKALQVSKEYSESLLNDVDAIFKQNLSTEDSYALGLIDFARLHDSENVYKIVDDLKAYDDEWQSLLSEYSLDNNSLQGSLWHNLNDMADIFQREVYNPIKGRAPIGYVPTGLEFKDTGTNAEDLYGRKVSTGGAEITSHLDSLNAKSNRGDAIAKDAERKEWLKTHPDTSPNYDSKKYVKDLKSDFGKRETGYSGSDMDYHIHRTIVNLFRKDSSAFKDAAKYIEMRDIVLPRIAKQYQVKLKPDFFFDAPSSTSRKFFTNVPDSEVSKLILKEGDEIVSAFNKEVKPVMEALLRDKVIPWADPKKFTPEVNPKIPYMNEAWVKRVKSNQEKMQYFLGYANENHPYAKQFRQIRHRLDVYKSKSGAYSFKYPGIYKFGNSKTVFKTRISTDFLTLDDYVNFQNAKINHDWKSPVKVPNPREAVNRIIAKDITKHVVANKTPLKPSLKATENLTDSIVKQIQDADSKQAADLIADFPTSTETVKESLAEALEIPVSLVSEPPEPKKNGAPEPPKTPEPPKQPSAPEGDVVKGSPKERYLAKLVNDAVVESSKARTKDRATLRTDFVKDLIDYTNKVSGDGSVTPDGVSTYRAIQTLLSDPSVRPEEFLDTLATSGMFQMAFRHAENYDDQLLAIRHNVAEINTAAGAEILKVIHRKLPTNGNTVIGAVWNTSIENIPAIIARKYKDISNTKLFSVVRDEGGLTDHMKAFMGTREYAKIDEAFNRVRQQEAAYAKVLGFKYDDTKHVKNVMKYDEHVAGYFANELYEGINTADLDNLTDVLLGLDCFKHLRGAWGSRRFDRRLIGTLGNFAPAGMELFENDITRIVKGSLGEGSFNNSKFQLYVGLFDNDNFKISQFASNVDDLKRIFYATLDDGSMSGNMANLTLAAPRFDNTGRIIGFTQFDKTTDAGLQAALNNADTILVPTHVLAPLDAVLRKDAKMSNKWYAWVHRHLTLPFKFGVLMNPGFIIGNANDAYLKQATTMANKYGTSVSEELANVSLAMKDVVVLNNKFDDAYRKFLVHIQEEGFTVAPTNHISETAAADPRIRNMLRNYVKGKLQKSKGSPLLDCRLSKEERNSIKLWLMLNSTAISSTFESGFQDMDVIAKAANASKYQTPKDPIDRIFTGKGKYVATDWSTWGLFANNPLQKAVMNLSEGTENMFRSAAILNDLRHEGADFEWFNEYFDTLAELDEAIKLGDPRGDAARLKAKLKEDFNFKLTNAMNAMHNANFDYEHMTDFTDTVGTFVPFPTFFLKNLAYWLDVMINNPQYIDHAITVQEGFWGSRDTSKDKFAAEAKGRGAVPIGGQNMSSFFRGIYKPTPLQSMFGAFSLLNSPIEDVYYRLNPAIGGAITAASKLPPIEPIAANILPAENVKYRPYSTDMYERNVTRDDPEFSPISYAIHRGNPMERSVQAAIRLPDKLRNDQAQLSDLLPSVFQPDFGNKTSK